MTPEEAIKISIHCLGVQAEHEVCEECPVYLEGGIACREVARAAISALKEIQQYRQIGTVEEVEQNARDLKRQIEHSEHLAEVLKATQNLLEKREKLLKEYCEIGTVEECRAAVEKQTAERIKYETDAVFNNGFGYYRIGKCPICNSCYNSNDEIKYCSKCGKKLDWSKENE